MNLDAETFIIEIMPLVFQVRMSLVCVEIEPDFSKIKNGYYTDNQMNTENTITLLYAANHYDILYKKEVKEDAFFASHVDIKKNHNHLKLQSFKLKGYCQNNITHNQMIHFVELDVNYCIECLRTYIEREASEVKERLQSGQDVKELIANPEIRYKGISLFESHIVEVTGLTFGELVAHVKLVKCIYCGKNRMQEKLRSVCEMNCFSCIDCGKEKIKIATKGLIVLNDYEKKKTKVRYTLKRSDLHSQFRFGSRKVSRFVQQLKRLAKKQSYEVHQETGRRLLCLRIAKQRKTFFCLQ